MNTDVHVAESRKEVQEMFAAYLNNFVKDHAGRFVQSALEAFRDQALAVPWNQRDHARADYRNGYYPRRLGTIHGLLDLKIPRCRYVSLDCSVIFDRFQRRMNDVDRIIRHAYLLGASTRGDAELAEQVFGGTLSPQSVSNLMKSIDDDLAAYRSQPITDCYHVVYIDGM